jgi:PAB1-binding protein PBP1
LVTQPVTHSLTHSPPIHLPNPPTQPTGPPWSTCLQISEEEQAEAEKIAENFEGKDSGGSIHVAEERNQEVDRKGLGEEELYSGVLRTCADAAKAANGSSRTAPPSSSPFHSAAEKSEEDDTSAAAVSNDEV